MGQLALIQMPRCRKRSSWYSILLSAPEVPWRPFATFSNKVCYSHAGYASGRTKVTSCGRHHSTAYSAGAAQSTIRGSLRVWPYTHAPHANGNTRVIKMARADLQFVIPRIHPGY